MSADKPSTLRPAGGAIHVGSRPPNRRRKSSSLGADPRGDTGGISFATSGLKPSRTPPQPPPPLPPSQQPHGKERGRKRRKARTALRRFKRLALRHTWLIPLLLTLTLLSLYFVSPGEHNPLHAAIFLSYPNPPLAERTDTLPAHIGNVTQYGKGWKDFAFVGFYIIVLSFTREFLMQRLIRPLGLRWGIRGKAKMSRFMEQFYTAIYFAVFGPFGLFVMSRTPVWYFNTTGMYAGFPHRAHESYFKAWYLLEAAYWAQQAIVLLLMLEKPRKDFKELVLHHIITLALIGLSYRFHFTYMGVAVYVTHDISDFFLATSKVFNYLDLWITGPYFVFFMSVWAYLRHYINLTILYSLLPFSIGLPGSNLFATVGRYDLEWETQQYKCWISQGITLVLLASLQAVNVFWFFLIIRILVRYLWKGEQKDERSEDEEDDEEELEDETPPALMNGSAAKHNETLAAVPAPDIKVNGRPMVAVEIPVASGIETESVSVRRTSRRS